jgi:hypothetical protein
MSRRRRIPKENKNFWNSGHFVDAFAAINNLERREAGMLQGETVLTMAQIGDSFMTKDIQGLLEAAKDQAHRPGYGQRQSYIISNGTLNIVTLNIDWEETPWLAPKYKLLPNSPVKQVAAAVNIIVQKWDRVRNVVIELHNRAATPGFVRYYWPCMMNLVKSDHPIQDIQPGSNFRHPDSGAGDLMEQFRETMPIVTNAQFMPPIPEKTEKKNVVTFVVGDYTKEGSRTYGFC